MIRGAAAHMPRTPRFGLSALAALTCALSLTLLAFADGGYFPTAWGWAALGLSWLATIAVLAPAPAIEVRSILFGAALAFFAGAIWLSVLWSQAGARTVEEGLRTLVLVLAVATALCVRRTQLPLLLTGVVGGVGMVSAYALATRLFPARLGIFDPVAGYRLSEPLGYWNALGVLAVMATGVAIAVASRSARPGTRALAATLLVLFAAAIYFTFSRGAVAALLLGLIVAALVDPRRLQMIATVAVLAPAPVAVVLVASQSEGLTRQTATLDAAAPEGRRLAMLVLVLALVNGFLSLLIRPIERRIDVPRKARRALNALLATAALIAVLAAVVALGGPAAASQRAYDAFSAPPPNVGPDLNQRFTTLSGSWRTDLWAGAISQWRARPIVGNGAGTYEQEWLEMREKPLKVRDAHSLYLETLAELGIVGLALLLVALSVPVYAAFRARRHPLVPAAFGAYVAYLVHAGVDWDWEMPAVTLTALFIGAAIVVAARPGDAEPRPLSPRVRYPALAVVLALMAVAFVGLVGNMALSESARAAQKADWPVAEEQARKAMTWARWSPEPWRRLGDAQLRQGNAAAAAESFRTATEKAPRDWSLWFDLARATSGEERQRALAEATRLNPLSPEIKRFREEELGVAPPVVEGGG